MSHSQLESFVGSIRTLSGRGNFQDVKQVIIKSWDVLMRHAPQLDTLLQTLDIQEHTLGYLSVLCVKLANPEIADFETLLVLVQEFVTYSNGEQLRSAPELFADMCHKLTNHLVQRRQTARGILILTKAIQKCQQHPGQLTSIHADLYQLCLLSHCLNPALTFLDTDVTDIAKEGNEFDSKYFLLYYYYGGMIYTALKRFERALYFFEIAITTPSAVVSHVVLESYKKWILVSLICHGKVPVLPKYTSNVAQRFVKFTFEDGMDYMMTELAPRPSFENRVLASEIFIQISDTNEDGRLSEEEPLCQAYHDIADCFVSQKASELHKKINDNQETFVRDNNVGLVKQVSKAFHKKTIQSLTKTFMTLSLTDVASRACLSGPDEAEKFILEMIDEGQIFALISHMDGMVRFLDNPERYDDENILSTLQKEMDQCYSLTQKLHEMDQELAVNPNYVRKVTSGLDDHADSAPVGTAKMLTS